MLLTFHNLQQTQSTLYTLLFGFICSVTWLCPVSTGCSHDKIKYASFKASPTGAACSTTTGEAAACSTLCSASSLCKIVYVTTCDANGQCTCAFCNQLTGIDFSQTNAVTFFNFQLIGVNTRQIHLAGGLVIGQPLLIMITLEDTMVSLNFMMANGRVAFITEIRFNERSVVSNSFLGYWGAEDRNTPHFNFQYGQKPWVFCVVNSERYDLYIDQVLFKQFPHRVPPSQVVEVTIGRENSLIKTFRR
ncbi:hypothetical protein RRG08_009547 [Elysia crispata]|uniref:Galectin n=1 Tax=Elysia crispata TaxID=231223 RepID=A0AAE1E6F0_9GAST|nr:hypothetical protein RRG08_009547 [Elysia crispata]